MLHRLRSTFAVSICLLAFISAVLPKGVARAEEERSLTADEVKYFETHVRPLLAANCVKCHGAGKQSGNLRLDSLDAMLQGGDSGPAITPGKPEESLLVEAINYASFEMPPTGQLEENAIATLTKWIEIGAPWPKDAEVRASEPKITDADRAWWAFQPVREPAIPDVGDGGWAVNPIDRFIFQKLTENGLAPSREADRLTLIRRASFDLTGLPPTQEEIDAFLSDDSPQAYEAMIDRLLESPRYGEHWARYWLDLVRYAESDGYKQDAYRPHAWRYRDYVIHSFNEDKPYDQFVREQLAGDETAPDDPEALAATGFLRSWIYEYNQRDVRGQWETILNDVTDVTADVFLGMGMGCARCHDHKFDPILQEDYYRLQAFFTPMFPRDDVLLLTPDERREYEAKLAAWEEMTAEVRAQIDEIEKPFRESIKKTILTKFEPDLKEMIFKPAEERLPLEHQLAELAYRQVGDEGGAVDAKIKGDVRKRWEELKAKLAEFDQHKPVPPKSITVSDVGAAASPTIIPGDHSGREIPPGFPTVLDPAPAAIAPPQNIASTGRRTALAQWINRDDNPLTHRVIVNRVWQYHFGEGLVATASDFGHLGEPPSHHELLDWLTVQFLNGRRLKPLHKLMMTSATYRQSAIRDPESAIASQSASPQSIDPSNRLLWRMNIRRLRAEEVRDAMLSATGELDQKAGGEGAETSQPRRSIYLKVLRNSPESLLETFDGADGFNSTARRQNTTTANQALLLFNGSWLIARSKAMKTRLEKDGAADDYAFVAAAWRRVFGRQPTTSETESSLEFLRQQAERVGGGPLTSDEQPPVVAMPRREGQALDVSEKTPGSRLTAPDNPTLPSGDFTIEAYVLLRSLYDDAAVRVIASQWNGDNNTPGWSLGVTSKKSKYTPQNLILQIVANSSDGKPAYEVVPSNLRLELDKPYYVAAAVKIKDEAPEATFYVKELAATDKPLQSAAVPLSVRGEYRGNASLVLGGRDGQARSNWDGLLDDVRLSSVALPPEELLVTNTADRETTVGLWRFEDQFGLHADSSGRDNRLYPASPTATPRSTSPRDAARIDFCHVLLNSNEFLYVD
jgi:mono/diheme cytochrome c family protein